MSDSLNNIFTDIANAIRNKKGTNNTMKPVDMSEEISSISTGIDTSDATATSNDILAGKTAYVNGNKIEGDILSYDGSYEGGIEIAEENDVINVDSFPTENIDEEKIYKANTKTNIDILLSFEGEVQSFSSMFPDTKYYFVDSLLENPIPSNITDTFNVYIVNDIAYIYISMDGSTDPTWCTISEFLYNMGLGVELDNKGFIKDKTLITEDGVYVTYSNSVAYGIKNKDIFQYDSYINEWISTNTKIDTLFDRTTIQYFNCSRYNAIPDYAFYKCKKLSNIKGTEKIKNIGDYAFESCESLTSVNFPNLVIINGYNSFSECSNLTNISMPLLKEIAGLGSFTNCTNLINIDFPELISGNSDSFMRCSSLENANLPKITRIESDMFCECTNLTTINAPSVTLIGERAFENCISLTKLTNETFPFLERLETRSFCNCSGLLEVELPAITIDDRSFNNCENLHTVNFSNATYIGAEAFNYCAKLINTNFPNVTRIEEGAFSSCYSLQKLVLPKLEDISTNNQAVFDSCVNLKIIDLGTISEIFGENLFINCKSLTTIILRNTTTVCKAPVSNIKIVDDECYHFTGTVDSEYNPNGLKDGRIYVPDELVESYKTSIYWTDVADFIVGLSELPEGE